MQQRNLRDTVLLSGWLFADLLLGLMMIFLATLPGAQPKPIIVPTLTVSPTNLNPKSPNCTGGTSTPQCTVTVGETPASVGSMTWTASSDMSDSVVFSASTNTLTPGESINVTISNIPCQNGSLTFTGSRGARPVTIIWSCTAPVIRLKSGYKKFTLNIDYKGLLSNSSAAINNVKSQIRSQSILQGSSVGLAIVYDGAPSDTDVAQALTVSRKIYGILAQLGQENFAFQRSSYYDPLFVLGGSPNIVEVDVYLFTQ